MTELYVSYRNFYACKLVYGYHEKPCKIVYSAYGIATLAIKNGINIDCIVFNENVSNDIVSDVARIMTHLSLITLARG